MLPILRWTNESITCIGAGIFGLTSVLRQGNLYSLSKYVGFSAIGAGLLFRFIRKRPMRICNPKQVVLITGCDSGLGYNMALHCNNLNMFVCAACLNVNSEGALKLREKCDPKRFMLMELDLRKSASILHAQRTILTLLLNDGSLEFNALINNAGMMCFGEFEWLTNSLIESQINVNLLGTMHLTRMFLPLVRKYRTRIINVTSHCALEALPGLSVYAATKAGLLFWNNALRVELSKYGINVVNFIPGSLVMSTNITARQEEFTKEMVRAFTKEQHEFYDEYFEEYNTYLMYISGVKPVEKINNEELFRKFENALLHEYPDATYKCEPIKYTIYHFLFKYCPTALRDRLIEDFVNFPRYRSKSIK